MTSISTRASLGRRATSTVERAGATAPSRSQIAGVDGVHGGEVVHVLQKDHGLDHAGEVGAGGGKHGFQVLEDPGGLLDDAARDDLAGGGIERDLAGGVDEVAETDGLRVGPDGGGSIGGSDGGLAGIVHVLILPGYEGLWQMDAEENAGAVK